MKSVFFKSLLLLGLLLGGYYLLFLRPKLKLSNTLAAIHNSLSEQHNTLLQTRLVLIEMAKLNPLSAGFDSDKNALLAKLVNETNKLKEVDDTLALNRLSNKEWEIAVEGLIDKQQQLIEVQAGLVDQLAAANEANKNIYKYQPQEDLGELTIVADSEELVRRAQAAKEGLETISEEVSQLQLDGVDLRVFNDQIKLVSAKVDELIAQPTEAAREEVTREFGQLKRNAFEIELAIIKSPIGIETVTDLTNLILEYDFWLDKINQQVVELTLLEPGN